MITMELLGKIRRMYVRDKMSVRAIAKRTGLSRNTLQKWLQASEEVAVPKYIRAKTFVKLAAFTAELEQSLKADASRNKQDRRTGKALFAQIKASRLRRRLHPCDRLYPCLACQRWQQRQSFLAFEVRPPPVSD